MADSTNPARADFIPYYPAEDPLVADHVTWDKVRIQGIPPSAPDRNSNAQQDMADSRRQAAGVYKPTEEESAHIEDLNEISMLEHPYHVTHWIRHCESDRLDLTFDINRLIRYFICKNRKDIVERLCGHDGADLARRDIHDRSVIFYALWPYPDNNMLTYIVSIFWDGDTLKDLNHRDENNQTLLDYAVKLEGADAAELLLVMKPDTKPELKHNMDLIRYFSFVPDIEVWGKATWIKVLFTCEQLVGALPDHASGLYLYSLQAFSRIPSSPSLPAAPGINYNITWLHFPWMPGIVLFSFLRRCGRDGKRSIDAAGTRFINIPGNPYTDVSYISNLEAMSDPQQCSGRQVHIVFPYLALRRIGYHFSQKKQIKRMAARSADYFSNSVLRPDRTLDEAYFPSFSAESLETRDWNQVVTREFGGEGRHPILNVPNLWVWRLGRNILTTYSASRSIFGFEHEPTILMSLMQSSHRPGIHIGLLIALHISDFGNHQADGDFPPPLDIFERSVARIVQEVDAYIDPKKLSRPNIKKEHAFMFRIADMREELVMIQHILGQQLEIVDSIIEDFENRDPDIKELLGSYSDLQNQESQNEGPERLIQDKKSWEVFKNSSGTIRRYQKRAKKIDGDAERLEKRIQDQLNLKRTHVSIDDARTGLLLSTAVIGFTVVTVIFAPLAFMTALFALPIDILVRNQVSSDGTSGNSGTAEAAEPTATYTTRYVATWFAVAEVASLAITILLVGLGLWRLGATDIIFDVARGDHPEEIEIRRQSFMSSEDDESDGAESLVVPTGRWNRAANRLRRRIRRKSTSNEV